MIDVSAHLLAYYGILCGPIILCSILTLFLLIFGGRNRDGCTRSAPAATYHLPIVLTSLSTAFNLLGPHLLVTLPMITLSTQSYVWLWILPSMVTACIVTYTIVLPISHYVNNISVCAYFEKRYSGGCMQNKARLATCLRVLSALVTVAMNVGYCVIIAHLATAVLRDMVVVRSPSPADLPHYERLSNYQDMASARDSMVAAEVENSVMNYVMVLAGLTTVIIWFLGSFAGCVGHYISGMLHFASAGTLCFLIAYYNFERFELPHFTAMTTTVDIPHQNYGNNYSVYNRNSLFANTSENINDYNSTTNRHNIFSSLPNISNETDPYNSHDTSAKGTTLGLNLTSLWKAVGFFEPLSSTFNSLSVGIGSLPLFIYLLSCDPVSKLAFGSVISLRKARGSLILTTLFCILLTIGLLPLSWIVLISGSPQNLASTCNVGNIRTLKLSNLTFPTIVVPPVPSQALISPIVTSYVSSLPDGNMVFQGLVGCCLIGSFVYSLSFRAYAVGAVLYEDILRQLSCTAKEEIDSNTNLSTGDSYYEPAGEGVSRASCVGQCFGATAFTAATLSLTALIIIYNCEDHFATLIVEDLSGIHGLVLVACLTGPLVALVVLGMLLPCTNVQGSLMALLAGICLVTTLAFGSHMVRKDLALSNLQAASIFRPTGLEKFEQGNSSSIANHRCYIDYRIIDRSGNLMTLRVSHWSEVIDNSEHDKNVSVPVTNSGTSSTGENGINRVSFKIPGRYNDTKSETVHNETSTSGNISPDTSGGRHKASNGQVDVADPILYLNGTRDPVVLPNTVNDSSFKGSFASNRGRPQSTNEHTNVSADEDNNSDGRNLIIDSNSSKPVVNGTTLFLIPDHVSGSELQSINKPVDLSSPSSTLLSLSAVTPTALPVLKNVDSDTTPALANVFNGSASTHQPQLLPDTRRDTPTANASVNFSSDKYKGNGSTVHFQSKLRHEMRQPFSNHMSREPDTIAAYLRDRARNAEPSSVNFNASLPRPKLASIDVFRTVILSVSPLYYPLLGVLLTLIIGIVFSLLAGGNNLYALDWNLIHWTMIGSCLTDVTYRRKTQPRSSVYRYSTGSGSRGTLRNGWTNRTQPEYILCRLTSSGCDSSTTRTGGVSGTLTSSAQSTPATGQASSFYIEDSSHMRLLKSNQSKKKRQAGYYYCDENDNELPDTHYSNLRLYQSLQRDATMQILE